MTSTPKAARLSLSETDRHILVTGATGLIGRAVVKQLLAAGNTVTAVVRPSRALEGKPNFKVVAIDFESPSLTDFSSLGRFDGIIHLAQASGWHAFPERAGAVASVCITATMYLAEMAVKFGTPKFVFASSGGIYGSSPHPIVESAPLKPDESLGFYLASKVAAENLLTYFKGSLTIHMLRPFFVYGVGQSQSFLLPRIVSAVHANEPIKLAGQGPKLNPLHVDDAAAFFIAALTWPEPVTSNLAGPDVVTLREIAEMAGSEFGVVPRFVDTGGKIENYVADTTRMMKFFPHERRSFRNGFDEVIKAKLGGKF